MRFLPTWNKLSVRFADIGEAYPPAFADLVLPKETLMLDEATVTANKGAWIEEALAALQ